MAAIADVLEAVRSVMLNNGYKQSTEPDGFDSAAPGRLHRQFYLDGPRLATESAIGKRWSDNRWELTVFFGVAPRKGSVDPDAGRFEVATLLDELIELWGEDSTINSDEFHMTAASPQWDEEHKFWGVRCDLQFLNRRAFT